MSENLQLDKFNGSPLVEQRIQVGFYILIIQACGRVNVYDAVGKSFKSRAQASSASRDMTLPEAYEHAIKHSKYIWANNDKDYLVEEYQLTTEFIQKFFEYTTPGIDKR